MTPVKHSHPQYQFYFPDIDVHVLVENHLDGVVLRASSRNFSERRKAFFIRHLATEGHIPIRYQWCAEGASDEFSGIQWVVDHSWLRIHPEITRRSTKFMRRLFIGAGILSLTMIALVFLQGR